MKFNIKNINLEHWAFEMLAVVGCLGAIGLGIWMGFRAFPPLGIYFFLSVVAVAYYARRDQDITDAVIEEAKEMLESRREARNERLK